MENLVSCRICGHTASTLARHIKAAHKITADEYRDRFPGARIRSEACEANRRAAAVRGHAKSPRKGRKKTIECPSCGTSREVGFTFAPSLHEVRCPACVERAALEAEDSKWLGKVEGADYVTCVGCGHRAESLVSHIQSQHPEWVGKYPGQIVAVNSSIRDKSALKGRQLSEETRLLMSENAGRWNKGLTKETDSRVAAQAKHRRGIPSWSKGLTKEDHQGLRSASETMRRRRQQRYWTNGTEVDLSRADFTPYLDETGAVDRRSMSESLGVCEPTITKYMQEVGLRLSTKYVDARVSADKESGHFYAMSRASAEKTTLRLTPEQLEPFRQKDGKVHIGRAMRGLGHVYAVVKRECDRLGIPTRTLLVRQGICLDAVSEALGGAPYRQEWESMKFCNPSTGRRFRFDGYFPDFALVVEFHGYQHWTFPSVWIRDRKLFDSMQERDRIKRRMIEEDPDLRYLEIREDEPYSNQDFLRQRLLDAGILDSP